MNVKITYYLEVVSSWCYWAEPTWAELKKRYAGQVEFGWKITQMPAEAYPTLQGAVRMVLSAQWDDRTVAFHVECGLVGTRFEAEWLAPNLVAEAAKDFGVT